MHGHDGSSWIATEYLTEGNVTSHELLVIIGNGIRVQ